MNDQHHRISRVCIVPGHLRIGGTVRVMLNLAEGLVERGVEVDLFLTRPPGALGYLVPPGVSVTVGRGSSARSLPALVRYLRHRRPDAVLAAHQVDNVVTVIARFIARVPAKVIVTVHNDRSMQPSVADLRRFVLTHAMRLAYPRAEAIVAVSDGVADYAARVLKLPRTAIEVIHNPTITRRMLENAGTPVQHPWLVSNDVPVVLAVGRLAAQKDFGTLIRAFSIVHREMAARLLILGEGEDRGKLERLVAGLDLGADVALPGTVTNPLAYMTIASVLVASSRWEGLSGVLIEALAVGATVVSTDCRSGPREILEDGRYGELVPVGDPVALASAVVRAIRNPMPRDRQMARGRWFSAERAADEYLALLTR